MERLTPNLLALGAARLSAASARVAAGAPLAVALFNDSGDDPQVVAQATSHARRRQLRRAGAEVRHAYFRGDWQELAAGTLEEGTAIALASPELRRVFAEVDALVVAGDTMRDQPHVHLLAILAAAQQMDVPTYLVNASLGDCADAGAVLARLSDCTVRDLDSTRRLTQLGVAHRLLPDTVFTAPFVDRAHRDFTGHLVVTDCHPSRRTGFVAALAAVRAAWPGMVADYALDAAGGTGAWRGAVADLATASVVLCGGYDGACLALRAGVPFVVLGPDPAASALLETIPGYPAAAADPSLSLAGRVAAVMAARAWFTAAGRTAAGRVDATFARLRPGFGGAGRDDTWSGSIDAVVAAVRMMTPPGGSVLHAGAGQGRIVEALARCGLRPWGADVARRLNRPDRNRYSPATPLALPFADHVFSTVLVSADWLEHLDADDLETAVDELARVGREVLLIEVSGRPLRADRAVATRSSADDWPHHGAALGLHRRAWPVAGADPTGPTGGTLLAMAVPAERAPRGRRDDGLPHRLTPVHPGVLAAATRARRWSRNELA